MCPGAYSVSVECSGISLCAQHSTSVSGRRPAADIWGHHSPSSSLSWQPDGCYWCHQLVRQLLATAPFPWLQPRHGTVWYHKSGLPLCYQLSGVKPKLIFSVSLMDDLNLSFLLFCSAWTKLGHVFLTFNLCKVPQQLFCHGVTIILTFVAVAVLDIVFNYYWNAQERGIVPSLLALQYQ